MILDNNTIIVPTTFRGYDEKFGKPGFKVGETYYVRKPRRFVGRDGLPYTPEGLVDIQVPVPITQMSGVDFEYSDFEMTMDLDNISETTLEPAGISIANKLDLRCANTIMLNTANHVGTPGTTPGSGASNAFLTYSAANAKLQQQGFPRDLHRYAIINSQFEMYWTDATKGLFNPSNVIGDQFQAGQIGRPVLGSNWGIDENLPSQTIGALGGTPAVAGAGQTGTSINLSGGTATVTNYFKAGDVISFAGVYLVNPQTKVPTKSLAQFVVQTNATTSGTGTVTVSVMPALVATGQFQNVTASPAAGALVNVYDTAAAGQSALAGVVSPQALVYHKTAFAFVSVPLEVPLNVDMGHLAKSKKTGVYLRFIRMFDGTRAMWINRFDVAYNTAPLYIEGSCRVSG